MLKDVKNAVCNEDGTITCDVQPDGVEHYLPYTAGPNDASEFGQELWKQLMVGTWGAPAPFVVAAEMVEAGKEQKRQEINAWRDAQEHASYVFKFNDHSWDYGKVSQARLEPVAMLAKRGQLPEGFFWTDAHNNDIPMTADEVMALEAAMIGAMVAKGFEIHRHQRELKAALDKLTTLDEVRAFKVA